MLIAPFKVGLERLHQAIKTRTLIVAVAEEDPLSVGQCRRKWFAYVLMQNRDDQLVHGDRALEFVSACL